MGSGFLIYCLPERFSYQSKVKGEPLGPVVLSIQGDQTKEREIKKYKDFEQGKRKELFACAVRGEQPGKFLAPISDKEGRILGKVAFRVTYERFHPWSPILSLSSFRPKEKIQDFCGIAFPYWNGSIPVPFENGDSSKGLLPRYLPVKESGLKISVSKKMILIESSSGIIASRPYKRFLARWWVNEKAVLLCASPNNWLDTSGNDLEVRQQKLLLPIDTDLQELKVDPNDRIGLQLLYCEQGCVRGGIGKNVLLLSNRLNFRATEVIQARRGGSQNIVGFDAGKEKVGAALFRNFRVE
jgi:hypothetical protein